MPSNSAFFKRPRTSSDDEDASFPYVQFKAKKPGLRLENITRLFNSSASAKVSDILQTCMDHLYQKFNLDKLELTQAERDHFLASYKGFQKTSGKLKSKANFDSEGNLFPELKKILPTNTEIFSSFFNEFYSILRAQTFNDDGSPQAWLIETVGKEAFDKKVRENGLFLVLIEIIFALKKALMDELKKNARDGSLKYFIEIINPLFDSEQKQIGGLLKKINEEIKTLNLQRGRELMLKSLSQESKQFLFQNNTQSLNNFLYKLTSLTEKDKIASELVTLNDLPQTAPGKSRISSARFSSDQSMGSPLARPPQKHKIIFQKNDQSSIKITLEEQFNQRDPQTSPTLDLKVQNGLSLISALSAAVPPELKNRLTPALIKEAIKWMKEYYQTINKAGFIDFLRTEVNPPLPATIQIENLATTLYKTYKDSTEQLEAFTAAPARLDPYAHNNYFPNDLFIRTAVHHVEAYLKLLGQADPHISINHAWDPHYVEAVMLYCEMKGYECTNNSGWKVELLDEKKAAFTPFFNTQYSTALDAKEVIHQNLQLDTDSASVQKTLLRDLRSRDPRQYPVHPHVKNFHKRGKSFYEGLLLILRNTPEAMLTEPRESLILKAADQFKTYSKDIELINDYTTGHQKITAFLNELNQFIHQYTTLDEPTEHHLKSAEHFASWSHRRPMQTTLSKEGEETFIQTEIPRNRLTEKQSEEYKNILSNTPPDWYLALAPWAQNYLKKNLEEGLKQGREVSDILQTIPCVLRYVPGLANYSEHVFMIQDEEGNCVAQSKRARSGIVTPLDLIDKPQNRELVERLTEQNLVQIIHTSLSEHVSSLNLEENEVLELPILFQTLVMTKLPKQWTGLNKEPMLQQIKEQSVFKIRAALEIIQANAAGKVEKLAWLKEIGLNVNDDGTISLKTIKGKEFTVAPLILSSNHTVTAVFRKFPDLWGNEKENLPTRKKIIVLAERNLERTDLSSKKKALLTQALEQYKQLPTLLQGRNNWQKGFQGQNRHRQLYLSSLEQLLVENCGGLVHITCKSGKDRTGATLLHTDAMITYFYRYGKLPAYDDSKEDRKVFCEIFADLYYTRHQQQNAQENSPGSVGIKTINRLLPKDLSEVIHQRYPNPESKNELKLSNKYGELNKFELEKIKSARPAV